MWQCCVNTFLKVVRQLVCENITLDAHLIPQNSLIKWSLDLSLSVKDPYPVIHSAPYKLYAVSNRSWSLYWVRTGSSCNPTHSVECIQSVQTRNNDAIVRTQLDIGLISYSKHYCKDHSIYSSCTSPTTSMKVSLVFQCHYHAVHPDVDTHAMARKQQTQKYYTYSSFPLTSLLKMWC